EDDDEDDDGARWAAHASMREAALWDTWNRGQRTSIRNLLDHMITIDSRQYIHEHRNRKLLLLIIGSSNRFRLPPVKTDIQIKRDKRLNTYNSARPFISFLISANVALEYQPEAIYEHRVKIQQLMNRKGGLRRGVN